LVHRQPKRNGGSEWVTPATYQIIFPFPAALLCVLFFSKKFQGRSAMESTQAKYLYIQSTKWKKLLSSFYSLDTPIFGVFLHAYLAHYSITDKQEGAISLFRTTSQQ